MTTIRVELELDDGSFTTRMLRAGQSIQQFEAQAGGGVRSINALQGASQGFLATLRDVTVVLGQASAAITFVRSVTTGWAGDIIKVNAEFERLRTLLAGMSKAADPLKDATQQLKELREFARTTPYSLQAITGVFTQMKSGGIEPMRGALRGLVDAVASFGGSEEVMKRASLAITQMSGKGVIQMEELRQQLGEAVPRATELMARSMGVTYGQLVKQISTGTVAAKPALELLNAEFERTFGGAAQQQMHTWNGLMASFATQMQNLAEGVGGQSNNENGFFNRAKKGAQDLIDLMQNPLIAGLYNKQGDLVADGLAQRLGSGLSGIVGAFDTIVRKAIEFRAEIWAVGEAMVFAFGATKGIQVVNALGASLALAGTQVAVLGAQLSKAGEQMRLANLAFAGAGTLTETRRAAASGARIAVVGVAVAFAELMPIIAVLGAAIYAAATYFDVFGSKAREAREEVVKFGGAASKQSLDIFTKSIEQASKRLDELRAKQARFNVQPGAKNFGAFGYDKQVADAEKALEADKRLLADAKANYEAEGAERAAQIRLRALDNETLTRRRALDRQGKDMADAQDKELARLTAGKQSTEKAQEAYAAAEKARQLEVYDVQIQANQRAYDRSKSLLNSLSGDKRREEEAYMSLVVKNLEDLQAKRKQAEASPMGVPKTSRVVDEEKLLDKGQKALNNIQASIAGLRAGLAGASVEVFELQQKLADGKFGPVDSGKVQELIQQLLQAQAEKSKLDELFEGKQKFDKDLNSGLLKAEQDLFEARNRNLSDYDKMLVKVQQGGYAGIGPNASPMERAMIAQRIATLQAGEAAVSMAQQVRQSIGETATNAVDGLVKKTKEAAEAFRSVGQAAGAVTLPNVAGAVASASTGVRMPTGSGDVVNKDLSAAARVFLNAISGPESAGRYNVRYTPGGGAIFDGYDQHPNIRERTKDGRWSTAAGRYQFTKETWDDYGGGDFSPANQDAKAWKLAQDRYRRNTGGGDLEGELRSNGFSEKIVQALQGTWEALTTGKGASQSRAIWQKQWNEQGDSNTVQRDSTYRPVRASDPQMEIPSVGLSPTQAEAFDRWRKIRQEINGQNLDNALGDQTEKLVRGWQEATEVADGYGKHVSALRKAILSGELGDDRNPEAERYKKAMTAAQAYDEADKERAKNQQDRSRLAAGEERRQREQAELEERSAALERQRHNQTNIDLSDAYYRRSAEAARELAAAERLRDAGHKDWDDGRIEQLRQSQAANLAALRNQEVLEMQQAELKKTQAVERENMTVEQARQAAFDAEVRRQQALVALTAEGSEARAVAEANATRRINAERAKLNNSSPITRQMKEWGQLSENFQKSATSWLDSSTDALAEFVTAGKADFASLFSSIAKDITKMGMKYALSSLFGGAGGAGGLGKLAGGGAAKATGAAGGAGKLFGAMHTGGIVGEGFSLSRFVSPDVFSGAPRFHSGGIIGSDEVPIIAQRGEGVFTAAQMQALGGAMGGASPININAPVTVNANGGSPAQNADLAAQTAKAMESMMRTVVVKELRKQTRPGNMLDN